MTDTEFLLRVEAEACELKARRIRERLSGLLEQKPQRKGARTVTPKVTRAAAAAAGVTSLDMARARKDLTS